MKFHPDIKSIADQLFLSFEEVRSGHMFGFPAYYVNKRLVACHYGDGLAIKLPEEMATEILQNQSFFAEPFTPMGRKMGNHWIILYAPHNKAFSLPAAVVEGAIFFAGGG